MASVQKVVGGSLSTVSKYFSRWRDARRETEPDASPPVPPEALSEAFRLALDGRSLELRAEFEERLREKQDEADALVESLATLEKRMADLEAEAREASEKAMMLMGENAELRDRLTSREMEMANLLKRDTESCSKCPAAVDVCRAVSDCMLLFKSEFETALREAVAASFKALSGGRSSSTGAAPKGPSSPKSRKSGARKGTSSGADVS
jgi:regulator of replication initiation timing